MPYPIDGELVLHTELCRLPRLALPGPKEPETSEGSGVVCGLLNIFKPSTAHQPRQQALQVVRCCEEAVKHSNHQAPRAQCAILALAPIRHMELPAGPEHPKSLAQGRDLVFSPQVVRNASVSGTVG